MDKVLVEKNKSWQRKARQRFWKEKLLINIAVTKVTVALISGSIALLLDAVHSLSDAMESFLFGLVLKSCKKLPRKVSLQVFTGFIKQKIL